MLALDCVSVTVSAGKFVALLGPSGCGKSTVLRLVAGLDAASNGQVVAPALHGSDNNSATTAFVFQEPTLMPWATVFDNVWLPLRLQGVARSAAMPVVRQVLARVGLAAFQAAYPAQLSGGMKMRASIARAQVSRPQVLLMANRPGRVVAELRSDAPYPRDNGFRHSPVVAQACRVLGAALAAAHPT